MAKSKKAESKKGGISRRDFIRATGLAVGGVAISSTVLSAACKTPTPTQPAATNPTGTTPTPTNPIPTTTPTGTTQPPAQIAAIPGLITLKVNGEDHVLKVKDWDTLAYTLRDGLGLMGTKIGCDEGICGSCTINIDGKPALSCSMLAVECQGKAITTVEGLEDPKTGKLSPIQQGFINQTGFMCSYCTSGQIMAANAFLAKNNAPTLDQVKEAMSNNICFCGGYELIQKSILNGASLMKGG